ncbi:MAG: hypothetical protein HYW24_02940 [Candidatus Aenigmarchaeota archaeon]|nr:hypothetical protein [Candidatus Aenigmarchaeota archaeon]
MAFEYDVNTFVNLFAFFGLTVATYTVFYFGRTISWKGVPLDLFTLALGINLIGLSYLLRVWTPTSPLINVTIAIGSAFLLIGVVWVFNGKSLDVSHLKKREEEIKSVIAKLKENYYQQELSEEDLKKAYSQLLRELAEIEVKLNKDSPAEKT